VPHLTRPVLKARHPLHVTLRLLKGIPSLRRSDVRRALESAFHAARERFGFGLVHYSIQGNHLHLIVEAEDATALSRGMQGLTIRCARAINRALHRKGKVFVDRFHAHVLRTRREVANAMRYVLENAEHHGEYTPRDPYTSQRWIWQLDETAPVRPPRTWLLRVGWKP
jgi:REP element-mobilizing transposase RayT